MTRDSVLNFDVLSICSLEVLYNQTQRGSAEEVLVFLFNDK